MRVLVTSTPGTGHLHPLVPLATELVAAGHEVVWATAASSCGKVADFGFRAVSSGLDPDAKRPMLLDRLAHVDNLPPRERRSVQLPIVFGEVTAPAMRDDLIEVFADVKPDLVIHEFAELAAAPMARARDIPCVCVGFSNAISDSVQTAVEASVAPVWELEGLQVSTETLNGDILLHPFPARLDTPRSDVPSAPMRPMSFDGASHTSPPGWADSFGKERPGVYVTFGTEMSPRAPWAALFEALSDLDVDVVATVGSQLDPATLRPSGPNIRVEQYVPQSFFIDRADVVVSHAGAGTVIGAATAGAVQLCIPIAADQWDNADLLSDANVGVVLEPEERDPTSFACQSNDSSTTRACVPALRSCATTSHRCRTRPKSRRRSTNWSESRSPRPHRVSGSPTAMICRSPRPEQEDRPRWDAAMESLIGRWPRAQRVEQRDNATARLGNRLDRSALPPSRRAAGMATRTSGARLGPQCGAAARVWTA